MSENPIPYIIDRQPVGDHLQVTIPDVGMVLETKPGQMKRDDAVDLALSAMSAYQRMQDEAAHMNG